MKTTVFLKESIYNCKIIITDSHGKREYYISALTNEGPLEACVTAEFYDDEFSISVIPLMTNTQEILDGIENKTWKDKLAKKASKMLLNVLDTMTLRVSCTYRIVGIRDGGRLDLNLQSYVFGAFDRFDILELAPVMYAFFEVFDFNRRFKLTDAHEVNRTQFLKAIKKFALAEAIGNGFLMYPIQMLRAKHLTKNKKICRTISKFNALSDEDRARFLEKQQKYMEK